MKQVTITLYNYSELSDTAKKRVLRDMYDINIDHAWYNCIFDAHKASLESLGYIDIKFHFNGFSSQGDGACFDAKIDIEKMLRGVNLSTGDFATIEKTAMANHYCHAKTRYIDGSINTKLLEKMNNDYQEQCEQLYRDLEKEYEYLTSTAAIIETIEANQYTFEGNGKMRNI